jgi:hypothetical protein
MVGARTADQLSDNLAARELVLPPEAVARLEAATGFEVGFPTDFIAQNSAWVFGAGHVDR